ncbi:putative E3 ubiquitin ligase sud1 [Sarracenia purpurea var. burkii]
MRYPQTVRRDSPVRTSGGARGLKDPVVIAKVNADKFAHLLLPITHSIKLNDIYAFVLGSYVIWSVVAGVRYSIDHIKTRRAAVMLNQIWKWCGIVLKCLALLSIWITLLFQVFVIPVLIGLLFELLVIVPMRVPVDESPVFLLYQDWSLGLIFLKIWTRLCPNLYSIRDDRYLIGRRLHNYGEEEEEGPRKRKNEAGNSLVKNEILIRGALD